MPAKGFRLTPYGSEGDPIFSAWLLANPVLWARVGTTLSPATAGDSLDMGAGNITAANLAISNWNTAYGWGNHASAGYLTSVTAHNLLSATHGDTLTDSVVAGDLMIGNATPKWSRLAKSTDGKVLTLVSGFPAWTALAAGTFSFGAANQIPVMNAGATDFGYSAKLKFDTTDGLNLSDLPIHTKRIYMDGY